MITIPPHKGERIAILGGSFNPPHVGHIAICDWLFNLNQVDRVWILPCYIHPFGKTLAPFDDRYRMCLFSFEQFGKKVEVSDIEMRMGGVSHTVRTIEYLTQHFSDVRFNFVVGGDVDAQKQSWHQFDKLKELVPIISVPRGPSSPIPDVSATDIRTRAAQGQSIAAMVTPAVAVYIITRQLY